MSARPYCHATTRKGAPCGFTPRHATGLCVNHDPTYRDQQRQNHQRAARASVEARRHVALPRLHIDLSTRAGVQAAIEAVVRLQVEGNIPSERAHAILRGLAIAHRNFDPAGYDPVTRRRPVRGTAAPHPRHQMDALYAALATQVTPHQATEEATP